MFLRKISVVLLSVLFLAACSPGLYSGGSWAKSAAAGESQASFGFSVESCDSDTVGHFNLSDEGWKVPVEISGHVTDFSEAGEYGEDCNFYALLEYVSANPDYPGDGQAVVCFGNEEVFKEAEVFGQLQVSVQSGPYEGYKNDGPIYGSVQSHQCDS